MNKRLFALFSLLTIGVVFALILIGGVVRSSGAGMGCPDWPKCFDRWVPPTDVLELPLNYQQIYHDRGYKDTTFNVVKTWTEYLNRLFGVLTGFFILLTTYFSVKAYWKKARVVAWWSIAALIVVLFQGWLGGQVVNTNLKPILISIHLVLALGVVALLQKARMVARVRDIDFNLESTSSLSLKWISAIMPILILVQIVIGTQVREAVDEAEMRIDDFSKVLNHLKGSAYFFHKVVVQLLIVWAILLLIRLKGYEGKRVLLMSRAMLTLLFLQMLMGYWMANAGISPIPQTLHVFLSSLLFGASFELWLLLKTDGYSAKQTQNSI